MHFREARRQTLLGVREALAAFEDLALAYRDDVPALGTLIGLAVVLRGLLDLWLSQIKPLDGDGHAAQTEARIEAFGVLRDLLLAELQRSGDDVARRDGLLTVIAVIDEEIERLAETLAAPTKETSTSTPQGVEWIEVES